MGLDLKPFRGFLQTITNALTTRNQSGLLPNQVLLKAGIPGLSPGLPQAASAATCSSSRKSTLLPGRSCDQKGSDAWREAGRSQASPSAGRNSLTPLQLLENQDY